MNTYHVSGQLKNEEIHEQFIKFIYRREVQAVSEQAALAQLEIDGWEFLPGVTVRYVSGAEKMERAGQPTLFPLPERGDHANRL